MRVGNSNLLHALAIGVLMLVVTLCEAKAGDVTVTDAWVRALPTSVPSGGYFKLHNGSNRPITLTGASSSACGMLMFHKSDNMGGMTSMEDVSSIDIPAGGTVRFSPGGYHLMCMGATPAIKPGKTVQVKLSFKDGSTIQSPFAVRNAAGK